jgi:hypothetical protein
LTELGVVEAAFASTTPSGAAAVEALHAPGA